MTIPSVIRCVGPMSAPIGKSTPPCDTFGNADEPIAAWRRIKNCREDSRASRSGLAGVDEGEGADGRYNALQDAWEHVRAEAEFTRICGFTIYDFSFASFATANGQSLFMVAKLLGHKQTRTAERYAHLAADPILAAANKTADPIAAAVREMSDLSPVTPTSPQTGPEPNGSEAA